MDMPKPPSPSEEPIYESLNGKELSFWGRDIFRVVNTLAAMKPGQSIAFIGHRSDIQRMIELLKAPGGVELKVEYDPELEYGRHGFWIRSRYPGVWRTLRHEDPQSYLSPDEEALMRAIASARSALGRLLSRLRQPSRWFRRSKSPGRSDQEPSSRGH